MPTWLWVVIVVAAALVVLGVLWSAIQARRTRGLQDRFGREYDKAAADAPSKREAETELRDRERRRDDLEITPLAPADRDRFSARWITAQADFVDDPAGAIVQADALIQEVMRARGYPVEEFETRVADLSVDHPDVVEHCRAAHGIAVAHERGSAGTEELRQAMKHYRALFDALVDTRVAQEARS